MPQENSENHENIKITLESYETHENLGFPLRIIKSKKKNLWKKNENHWDIRSPRKISEN